MFWIGRFLFCCGLLAGCAGTDGPLPTADADSAPFQHGWLGLPNDVRLIGLGSGDLESLLGRPALIRSEQKAQYWRYSLGACQLDLFLYAESADAPPLVIYLDARPSGYVTSGDAALCAELAAFLRGEPAPKRPDLPPDDGSPLPVAAQT